MLVERHRHTFTTTADSDTGIYFTAFDTFSQCVGKIGIINTLVTVRTIIFIRISVFFQILNHELLQCVACMVTSQSYCFYFHS